AAADLLRRLDAGVIHLTSATRHSVGRPAPRLEETRRPEPLVDANALHGPQPRSPALLPEGEPGLVRGAVTKRDGQIGTRSRPRLAGRGEVGVAVERRVVREGADRRRRGRGRVAGSP